MLLTREPVAANPGITLRELRDMLSVRVAKHARLGEQSGEVAQH